MNEYIIPAQYSTLINSLSWTELLEASDVLKMCLNGRKLIQLGTLPPTIRTLVQMLDKEDRAEKGRLIISLVQQINEIVIQENQQDLTIPNSFQYSINDFFY